MTDDRLFYCEKCKKTMKAINFYGSNNTEKYPEGKLHLCKDCITMHVDNWNPETYVPILQECDVPYIPSEWDQLLATYGKDKTKVTGTTIIGRYLSKMKLKQHKDHRWADTEHLQNLANKKIEETMKRQGYSAVQIEQAIMTGQFDIPQQTFEEAVKPNEKIDVGHYEQNADYFQENNDIDAITPELTDEDKVYLQLKWGNMYKQTEWVQLEQLYQEMMNSYDITAAGDINTLKLACKASLKANQLMDLGDIEGAQKMSKVYNDYMKAGKWTAAQNKTEEAEVVDSIGELVAICERDHFIEKYYIDRPKDKVDRVIQDMQKYTHDLVTEETGLNNLMELAFKHMQEEEEQIKAAGDEEDNEEAAEDALFKYEVEPVTDKDFMDFEQFKEDEILEDIEQNTQYNETMSKIVKRAKGRI